MIHKHMLRLTQTTPYWYLFTCEVCGEMIECEKHTYWRRRFSWEDNYHTKNPNGIIVTPADKKEIHRIRMWIKGLIRG